MITGIGLLLVLHVFCTTLGYAGLACINLWLAIVLRQGDAAAVTSAARASLQTERVVGPFLGIGIVLGFAMAYVARLPLATTWLLAAYALVAAGGAIQLLVAVPWHVQAARSISGTLDMRRPALAAWAFGIDMLLLIGVMIAKP